MAKTLEERIAGLKARKEEARRELLKLEAAARLNDRKLDARRKIVVGAAVLAHMEQDPNFNRTVRRILANAVTRPKDRETLGELLQIPPYAPSPAPANLERPVMLPSASNAG